MVGHLFNQVQLINAIDKVMQHRLHFYQLQNVSMRGSVSENALTDLQFNLNPHFPEPKKCKMQKHPEISYYFRAISPTTTL